MILDGLETFALWLTQAGVFGDVRTENSELIGFHSGWMPLVMLSN
jgi:hypothetical protein